MRVLLDEHLPYRLRHLFALDVEVITVAYLGWKGKRNGALLRAAQDEGFDVLVTMDRGLPVEMYLNLYHEVGRDTMMAGLPWSPEELGVQIQAQPDRIK